MQRLSAAALWVLAAGSAATAVRRLVRLVRAGR